MHLIFIHQAILMNEVNNNAREIYRIIQDLYNLCKHVRFDPCFRVKRKIRLFSFANYRENENMIIYCRRLRDRPIIVISLHSHFFFPFFFKLFLCQWLCAFWWYHGSRIPFVTNYYKRMFIESDRIVKIFVVIILMRKSKREILSWKRSIGFQTSSKWF